MRKSTLAKLSLIFSCCSPITPLFIGSIGGIVCGHMAMNEFRRDPGLVGKKMAMWGLSIGYVSIPLAFLSGYFILRILGH
jgi:Domain of unknown function (DUF4190)